MKQEEDDDKESQLKRSRLTNPSPSELISTLTISDSDKENSDLASKRPLSVQARVFQPRILRSKGAATARCVDGKKHFKFTPSPMAKPFDPSFAYKTESKDTYFELSTSPLPREFTLALDAIFGFPLSGSLCFLSDGNGFSQTSWTHAGDGKASISKVINEKLKVDIESAGIRDGDFSKILVNGKDLSPNQKGINMLVIDPVTLNAFIGAFNTVKQEKNESLHLARFLVGISDKKIIALSVRYDAARRLTSEAKLALRARGIQFPESDNVEALKKVVNELDKDKSAELLSMCAYVNAHKCARVLIQNGWDVNFQKKHGSKNTALIEAVFHGSIQTLKVLLENNADQDLQNKWNETAKDIANKLFGFKTLDEMTASTTSNDTNKIEERVDSKN